MIDLSMTFEDMKNRILNPEKTFSNIFSRDLYPNLYFEDSGFCTRDFTNFIKMNFFDDIFPNGFTKNNVSTYHFVVDILYNSLERGNKLDVSLPIFVEMWKGDRGRILSVEDCGDGFDVYEKLMQKKMGKKYFENGGRGLMLFDKFEGIVSYNDIGNKINVMYESFPNK